MCGRHGRYRDAMTISQQPTEQPPQSQAAWTPPVDAAPPADGWGNNAIALRARKLLVTDLWILAAGVLCIGLTFIPSPTLQTFVILALWLALLAVFVLAVIVVIFASIGLYRASRLGRLPSGHRPGIALRRSQSAVRPSRGADSGHDPQLCASLTATNSLPVCQARTSQLASDASGLAF